MISVLCVRDPVHDLHRPGILPQWSHPAVLWVGNGEHLPHHWDNDQWHHEPHLQYHPIVLCACLPHSQCWWVLRQSTGFILYKWFSFVMSSHAKYCFVLYNEWFSFVMLYIRHSQRWTSLIVVFFIRSLATNSVSPLVNMFSQCNNTFGFDTCLLTLYWVDSFLMWHPAVGRQF